MDTTLILGINKGFHLSDKSKKTKHGKLPNRPNTRPLTKIITAGHTLMSWFAMMWSEYNVYPSLCRIYAIAPKLYLPFVLFLDIALSQVVEISPHGRPWHIHYVGQSGPVVYCLSWAKLLGDLYGLFSLLKGSFLSLISVVTFTHVNWYILESTRMCSWRQCCHALESMPLCRR